MLHGHVSACFSIAVVGKSGFDTLTVIFKVSKVSLSTRSLHFLTAQMNHFIFSLLYLESMHIRYDAWIQQHMMS